MNCCIHINVLTSVWIYISPVVESFCHLVHHSMLLSSIVSITGSCIALRNVEILWHGAKLQIETVWISNVSINWVLLSRSSTWSMNWWFLFFFLTNLLSNMCSGVISQEGSLFPCDEQHWNIKNKMFLMLFREVAWPKGQKNYFPYGAIKLFYLYISCWLIWFGLTNEKPLSGKDNLWIC